MTTTTDTTNRPATMDAPVSPDEIATAPTAPGLGIVPTHKKQLRERIEARLAELTETLLQLGRDPAFEERVRAVETALQGLEAHIGGGWENVGAVEAAQLARWLESTRLLGAAPPEAEASPADSEERALTEDHELAGFAAAAQ